MNKYASGYTLIQILSVIGWLIIIVSIIGGVLIASNADRGMGWVGISVAVAGSFQGLLLLGMGAIGTAILDGSVASQRNIEIKEHSSLSKPNSAPNSDLHDEVRALIEMMRLVVASSLGKPGLSFAEISYGNLVFKKFDGTYIANEVVYDSLDIARRELKKSWFDGKNSLNLGEDVVYNGYRVSYSQGRYLINGISFKEPVEVIQYLDNEIKFGGHKISRYKIII